MRKYIKTILILSIFKITDHYVGKKTIVKFRGLEIALVLGDTGAVEPRTAEQRVDSVDAHDVRRRRPESPTPPATPTLWP
ncbi:hypothetical protein COW36_02205 [bacterium (Candidatus Blackallbacteria) CG17_big_fil_post_rev_8_21_14_2_50_48_46]|uniref:Uncharacterized protein n=1 Tax=bacterium (Candidatus Blackallbacteria) CG17_big_fil_post_rev_8_21_14_2_50_48_46 TaxID=2014261 RepID=A0A2M7GA26_9BACT|nr:MAG: hypothetical protein COW64_13265 [bacterium (Candidatus Blackallbacteria) CG18_big_fil_WC_8_21_14_2_50_49_26]PIW18944.1 MAG: hypothetical protein COW36_02205 [bacterium (Candidatus Blackallbacteria) CG17_big_fil_post_rev_8_21_14_2_50_48_46]PIW44688.1 MAG: hypothetical protein COW20_23910 [bacterium (Candidatus Blackallbacteria) CG13_big_fil_rev_8_21_14_2_50_49_14]